MKAAKDSVFAPLCCFWGVGVMGLMEMFGVVVGRVLDKRTIGAA